MIALGMGFAAISLKLPILPDQIIAPPALFDMTVPFDITRAADWSVTHNYDIDAQRAQIAYTGTIYVKPGGSNTLDGSSPANAVASLNKAITLANARAAPTRILADPGLYRATSVNNAVSAFFNGVSPTVDLLIESSTPGQKIISLCDVTPPAFAATATDATVYVCTYTTQAITDGVIDRANVDANGRPKALRRCFPASSAEADVVAALNARIAEPAPAGGQGAFYRDATNKKLYVKLIGSRAPDANMVVLAGVAYNFQLTSTVQDRKLWMSDVELWGAGVCLRTNSGAGRNPKVWLKESAVCYATTAHGVNTSGGGIDIVSVGVQAESCMRNGFAYNGVAGGTVANNARFIELDCKSWFNGWGSDSDTASNASSGNNTARGVRVNCAYVGSSNRTLQDTQDSRSWNVNVLAGPPRAVPNPLNFSANFASGYLGLTNTSIVWLDHCVSAPGTLYDLQAYDGGQLFFANMDDVGAVYDISGAGSGIAPYSSTLIPTTGPVNGSANFSMQAGARLIAAIH